MPFRLVSNRILQEFTRNLKLFHNEIKEVPTGAVRNGWRFLAWRNHTANIEYAWNKTAKVGQAGLEDFFALYISCCNAPGSSIHHNYVNSAGLRDGTFGIYLDVYTNYAQVYNNVCKNMPQKSGSLLPGFGGWMGLVIAKHNRIFNNWSDSKRKTDISPPHLRYFWPSLTNKFYDNHFQAPGNEDWPEEARQVMELAGLEAEHSGIKEIVDAELDKGYMPLTENYMMPGKQLS